jgi:hypothetical protein
MSVSVLQRSVRAGWELSAQSITWGKRPATPRPTVPASRDLRLMLLLYEANYLSASQLTLLGWGRASDAAGKRLRRLHDSGYLDKFRGPAATGSSEWNYRLTQHAWQTLTQHGLTDGAYKPVELHSIAYTEHDLQLAGLVLHIAQAATTGREGPLLERLPFTWHGPRTGRIDPVQGKSPTVLSPAARLPAGIQLHHGQSTPGYLEPDATLTVQAASGERFAVLVEYDRTGKAHRQVDRLRRYEHFLLDGFRHTHFATHAIPPTVLYITTRPAALASLLHAADRTLTAWHGPPHANARDGVYPARERILLTTRQQILNGNWVMQRASRRPSLAGEPSGTGASRTVSYDLPSMLAAR